MMGPLRQVDLTPVTFESDVPSLLSGWGKDKGLVTNLKSVVDKIHGPTVAGQGAKSVLDSYYETVMSKEI